MSERVRFGVKNNRDLFVNIEAGDTSSVIQNKINEAIASSRDAGFVRIEEWVEKNSKGVRPNIGELSHDFER